MTLIDTLIGRYLSDVESELDEYHIKHRVSQKDGQFYVLTRDYDPDRFNLTVNTGVVTEIKLG